MTATLATPADPVAQVPDGWALVPVEPTEAMIAAGEVAAWDDLNSMPMIRAMRAAYRAMLTAAPNPPSESEQGDEVREALQNALFGMEFLHRELSVAWGFSGVPKQIIRPWERLSEEINRASAALKSSGRAG